MIPEYHLVASVYRTLVYQKRLFRQSVQEATDLTQLDVWKTNLHAPDEGKFINRCDNAVS